VKHRQSVAPRAAFSGQTYWGKPVPGFGDLSGRLLVLGIAPAAHGGNRTGRVFTGDSSGRFLVRALYSAGFANKPVSESIDDGLTYTDCYITAAVKCVPPGDRPNRIEFKNCSGFLEEEIRLMHNIRAVLALGALSFGAFVDHLRTEGYNPKGLKFEHGRRYQLEGRPSLYASYHPSPRNTNTGVLSPGMLVRLLKRIKSDLDESDLPSKHN
jgi:uracil-DNA glycosylase family 4